MTVATKLEKAVTHLKSAQASFQTFALDTKDKAAQSLYRDAARETEQLIRSVEQRLGHIQEEEPEYQTQ